ncbi:hypothetical protein GCM10010207_31110 [Streptomyces atratus]|uniref:hypothetical protein n=2 Tax=Streptomyces atratus TaxID=1893 RepID=UPI001670FC53|nr:hypothetical protein GCM10010207_31110 [Streptomyces atratus]
MDVPGLMPEVPMAQRLGVSVRQGIPPRDRLHISRCEASGACGPLGVCAEPPPGEGSANTVRYAGSG